MAKGKAAGGCMIRGRTARLKASQPRGLQLRYSRYTSVVMLPYVFPPTVCASVIEHACTQRSPALAAAGSRREACAHRSSATLAAILGPPRAGLGGKPSRQLGRVPALAVGLLLREKAWPHPWREHLTGPLPLWARASTGS